MKTKIISCFLFGTLVFLSVSFSTSKKENEYHKKSTRFLTYAEEVEQSFLELIKTAKTYQLGNSSTDSLRSKVIQARLSYKKIEFYLAFYYHDYVEEHLNGAPLLGIERSGAQADILPPEGLQVLDELAFSKNPKNHKTQITSLAQKLYNHYKLLHQAIKKQPIAGEKEIAAIRMAMVRIFTLGVTGFDTPGSLHGIREAQVALTSIQSFLKDYQGQHQATEIAKTILLLEDAIGYLDKNQSFENFDRLTFLMDYIDPIYQKLLPLQKDVPVFLKHSSAWNPESTSLFAENFLNPYFFVELTKKENSPELKKLGKQLFFDPILSAHGKMSCASCHNPKKAFADGRIKSISNTHGKTVLRNAPTLINAVYADRFFYDLRAFTLEQQVEHVIFNPEEFNTAYSTILQKLREEKKYKRSFEKVFGKKAITRENFSKALASYVLSLRSFDSKFDRYVRGEIQEIGSSVKRGFNLFMGKANCATCHFPPTFAGLVPPFYSDSESEILGVFENPRAEKLRVDSDPGRYGSPVKTEQAWIYEKSFKTTTIRNAGLTAPYFHNGAYKTLIEVIEFYDLGGGAGQGFEVKNQTLGADPLNLTETEKLDLIAFIEALNDNTIR